MRTTAELREGFLSFFEEREHLRFPSFPLLPPPEDPSTLFISAGMQPLKPYFSGLKQPPAPRFTTVQKCLRAGGKDTDLDEVGLTARHASMFEMLGNFSFGDYFKDGAVDYAWEFVTERLGFEPERLWASVFAGDPGLGLGEDDVAVQAWLRKGLPRERIVPFPRSENFWGPAGETGPCGPCSELHYDRGAEHGCGERDCGPNCERCDRYIEFWNLVFMEFDLAADGSLTPLPKQNIDTGMGLERCAMLVQDVETIFDTDGFRLIMDWIEGESGVHYGSSPEANEGAPGALRPRSRDHVPRRRRGDAGQRGAGLRPAPPHPPLGRPGAPDRPASRPPAARDRRRAGRALVSGGRGERNRDRAGRARRGGALPRDARPRPPGVRGAGGRRHRRRRCLPARRDVRLPDRADRRARGRARSRGRRRRLPRGDAAPPGDLARRRARRASGSAQRTSPRAPASRPTSSATRRPTCSPSSARSRSSATARSSRSCGSRRSTPPAAARSPTRAGSSATTTPGRGPSSSTRTASTSDQALVFRGEGFAAGDRVRAVVPWSVRFPTMANHTATHLLQAALREVLGDHVAQAGSAVRPDKLRFDFTHGSQLSGDERERIEQLVNRAVFANTPVHTFETTLDEARSLGAMALFGEKYGDVVRVVDVKDVSTELCGGTHVRSTAEIGAFAILSEGSVGGGARRIEAVTSGEAWAALHARATRGRRAASRARGRAARAQAQAAGERREPRPGAARLGGRRRQRRRPARRGLRRRRAARALGSLQAASRTGGGRARRGGGRAESRSSRTSTRPSPRGSAPPT